MAILVGSIGVANATTYDASKDFYIGTNPGGNSSPWTYGWSASLGSTLNVFKGYSGNGQDYFSGTNVSAWFDNQIMQSGVPTVMKNNSNGYIAINGTAVVPAANSDKLLFHPGPNGQYAVIQWTAPSAGDYNVSSLFTGQDNHGTTTDVHVLHNGVSFYDGFINGYLASDSENKTISVAKGDTISFKVGYGSNNFYGWDSTGIAATISPVPEAEEWAMMMVGLGLVGMVANRKKTDSFTITQA